MSKEKILIVVKTYPTLSVTYGELVCTAGFREDGSWVRIYPVPFRKLDYEKRYKKWEWIELDIVRNKKDFRPETFHPYDIDGDIKVVGSIPSSHWELRRKIVLQNVKTDMEELICEAKSKSQTSLAVFKPPKIHDFIFEKTDREWDQEKLEALQAEARQLRLFEPTLVEKLFNPVMKIPYKFSYVFEGADNKMRTMMIEDWELGQLYLNCLKRADGDEAVACQKVKEKYLDYMWGKRDLCFFLGTTKQHHNVAKNPFIIIGAFYPPHLSSENQLALF